MSKWLPTVLTGIGTSLTGALLLGGLALAAPNWSGYPNPQHNTHSAFTYACSVDGYSSSLCTQAVVAQINQVDQKEQAPGGKIFLPPNYQTLTPAEQTFVLTNLNRLAFNLPPVPAMSPTLNTYAVTGAQNRTDPIIPSSVPNYGWASNWAMDLNPAASDFTWMYDDGLNSGNLDCTSTNQTGCWGHRDNILTNFSLLMQGFVPTSGYSLYYGAGVASAHYHMISDATVIMATSTALKTSFTWQQVLSSYPSGQEPVVPFAQAPVTPVDVPSGTIVTVGSAQRLYQIHHNMLSPIPDRTIADQLAGSTRPSFPMILSIQTQGLSIGTPLITPFRSGTLLRTRGSSTIYQVIGGVLHPLASPRVLPLLGDTTHQIVSVPSIPTFWPVGMPETTTIHPWYQGEAVQFNHRGPVYLFWNGFFHRIANAAAFHALGLTPAEVSHPAAQLPFVRVGVPVSTTQPWIPSGTLLRAVGHPAIYLVAGGMLWRVPSMAVFRQQGAQWNQVRLVPTLPHLPLGPTL